MRCSDVIRAIAAPADAIDPAELESHLAGCRRCARWAEQAGRLDRVWEATRPEPPTPAAWESAWANIESALEVEAAGADRRARPASMPWSARAISGVVLAAAAAVLIALGVGALLPSVGDRPSGGPRVADSPDPKPMPPADPIRRQVDVEIGQTVLYNVDRGDSTVVQVNDPATVAVDPYYLMFNVAETLPEITASNQNGPAFSADPMSR